jgi:hypothetical protein
MQVPAGWKTARLSDSGTLLTVTSSVLDRVVVTTFDYSPPTVALGPELVLWHTSGDHIAVEINIWLRRQRTKVVLCLV